MNFQNKISLQDKADVMICMKQLALSENDKCKVNKRISKNAKNLLILAGLDVNRNFFSTTIEGVPKRNFIIE